MRIMILCAEAQSSQRKLNIITPRSQRLNIKYDPTSDFRSEVGGRRRGEWRVKSLLSYNDLDSYAKYRKMILMFCSFWLKNSSILSCLSITSILATFFFFSTIFIMHQTLDKQQTLV